MAKPQVKITLPSGTMQEVEWISAATGEGTSEVISGLVKVGAPVRVREVREIGQIVGLSMPEQPSNLSDEFVKALAERKKFDLLKLQKLADSLGVPSESLAELIADCCCEAEEKTKNAIA